MPLRVACANKVTARDVTQLAGCLIAHVVWRERDAATLVRDASGKRPNLKQRQTWTAQGETLNKK